MLVALARGQYGFFNISYKEKGLRLDWQLLL